MGLPLTLTLFQKVGSIIILASHESLVDKNALQAVQLIQNGGQVREMSIISIFLIHLRKA